MVLALLVDLEQYCKRDLLEVILTLNISEELSFGTDDFSFPVVLIVNSTPQGFSANHNQAFTQSTGQLFCVLNPDIRLNANPFPALQANLLDSTVGVVSPLVMSPSGALEDSARRFPTPLKIICKLFSRCRGSDYCIENEPIRPDWVAGMFLLFPSAVFKELRGFDQRYFLYYEDVDICARLRLLGQEVVLCPQSRVIHHARRTSHRSLRYLRWHLASMMRFFFSPVYWRLQFRKCLGIHRRGKV